MHIISYRTARLACALILVPSLLSLFIAGCKAPPLVKPTLRTFVPPPVSPVPKTETPSVDLSHAVRAHVLKLRELRDSGLITEAEYQSRKESLAGR